MIKPCCIVASKLGFFNKHKQGMNRFCFWSLSIYSHKTLPDGKTALWSFTQWQFSVFSEFFAIFVTLHIEPVVVCTRVVIWFCFTNIAFIIT
jgi:hypothetical protein